MSDLAQQHCIKQQVLEVTITSADYQSHACSTVERVYHNTIVPWLDQYLSQLSHIDVEHRIESLVIDLGHISLDQLEEKFIDLFKEKLQQQLPSHLCQMSALDFPVVDEAQNDDNAADKNHSSQKKKVTKNNTELFGFFSKTGTLPWWSEKLTTTQLQQRFADFINDEPQACQQVIFSSLQYKHSAERLIYQLSDENLLAACHLLAIETDVVESIQHDLTKIF
ncbi:MAG: hypothetical protein JKY13_01655, partial [Gammaproteobacteria bacterium]|nr:hypothetical protein [Gammaproteobacteria bacterium]